MKPDDLAFVDRGVVHKRNIENVHIYNLRRALHRTVDADVMNRILEELTPPDREYLLDFYHFEGGDFRELALDEPPAYVLRNVPSMIPFGRARAYLNNKDLGAGDLNYLLSFYEADPSNEKVRLIKNPTEADEARIHALLKVRDLHVTDEQRHRLAQILEPFSELERKNVFFANVYVDPAHPYFFEHPQEHVPGMFLIESSRQMAEACWHIYGGVPLKGAAMMVSKIECDFQNYVELNFPIKLRARPVEFTVDKAGYWSQLTIETHVFQKSKDVARILLSGGILTQKIFSRIRAYKDDFDQTPRFRPRTGFENHMSVRDGEGRELRGDIIDISTKGFLIESGDKVDHVVGDSLDFYCTFGSVGLFMGQAVLRWTEGDDGGRYWAGFEITHIGSRDKEKLGEALKRYCYVQEEREIL